MPRRSPPKIHLIIFTAVASACPLAQAMDINGVLPAAADQPQTHVYLETAVPDGHGGTMPGSIVQVDDGFGDTVYDIQGFLDTGTSGVLLSLETQQGLNLALQNGVTFQDIAVGGEDTYNVSVPYYLSVAPFSIDNDIEIGNPPPTTDQYTRVTGPIPLQTNPVPADEFVGPIDIFGMPVMQSKVVVLDFRPDNDPNPDDFGETKTYLYNPGTPFNPATEDTNPGIPVGQLHVKLSYGDFSQFTQLLPSTTPAADGPAQFPNPMIGPDPVSKFNTGSTDNTPPVRLNFAGHSTTGSFLFDTGAQASFISSAIALTLHVEYATDAEGNQLLDANGDPYLISTDPGHAMIPNQFALAVTGAGGATVDAAGFELDRLSIPTLEGDPINFQNAPVLVTDVTAQDPVTGKILTLDGDFGMNFLEPSITPDLSQETAGPFDWATFDQPDGILGLTLTAGSIVPVVVPTGNSLPAASDSDIGPAGSDLSLYGGTLAVTGSFASTRALAISLTGGTINIAPAQTLTMNPTELTWAGGTLSTTNSGTLVLAMTTNDVAITSGAALNIAAASSVIINGSIDPFTDSLLPADHVAIVNNGSLTFNINSAIAGITGNGHLTLAANSTLQIAPATGLSTVASLTINPNSTLDLTNNSLIINYSKGADPIATIQQYLKTGYNHGAWTGPGLSSSFAAINSNFALGYADGADGIVPGLSTGQIEIKYTLYGDINLDGLVNATDFAIFGANFGQAVTGWDHGDFTYDGTVNATDFALFGRNFGSSANGPAISLPAIDWSAFDAFAAANNLPLNVPEPATLAIPILALTICHRKRKPPAREIRNLRSEI